MIWFKHCYWPDVEEWRCIGLPRNQSATTVLARYQHGDHVLLALARARAHELRGKIFAVCTLRREPGPIAEFISPKIDPDVAVRWPVAIPIAKLWEVHPLDYGEVADGALAHQAMYNRGKLFRVGVGDTELEDWLRTVPRRSISL